MEIERRDYPASGYAPVVDSGGWRVAVLRFCADLRIENIHTMQKHRESDEVFVLTAGSCTLFEAGRGEAPGAVRAVPLTPHCAYVVPKGVWHNHIMDEAGEVVIAENRDTCDANSPVLPVDNAAVRAAAGL